MVEPFSTNRGARAKQTPQAKNCIYAHNRERKRKYKTEAGITEVSSIREALNGQNKSLLMRKKKRKKYLVLIDGITDTVKGISNKEDVQVLVLMILKKREDHSHSL